ncbi:sugar ABC transporter permease [Clavibacter michiganensis]|uniref:ABC transporter permease n=1 Tax=Clavibacter michiganensis TaxID=28447 RepID=UPI000CE84CAB|nr:ABC transporter permease [Clavibacter michiganensis]PPF89093.1 sugar ABC transporter permease [Clavibacter michiganensis]PPF92440.1 sugar ABC transporter permease [Clavibacter michiganensis]
MSSMTSSQSREFSRPGTGAGLLDVYRRRYLLSLLVKKEVQVRYRGSVLGWLWSYVKPAAQFAVFFVAMGVFLQLNRNQVNYPVYLFSGIILINFYTEAFSNSTKSLVDNGALIKKIYLPRELFPVSSTFVALVNFLPQLVILLIVCLLVGWAPTPVQVLGIFLAVAIIGTLAIGLGMLFGAANVSFRDSQNFVELIVMVVVWASPVLYPYAQVAKVLPDWLLVIYQLNPVTAAVELFHAAFWYPTTGGSGELPPNLWVYGFIALGVSLLSLLLGQLVFKKLEGRFAQDL